MKPPRYLLREFALMEIIKEYKPGKFLEFGYGAGEMLLTLRGKRFYGDGYDFSKEAFIRTKNLLDKNKVSSIKLLTSINSCQEKYDYIFLLEVIGYLKDIDKKLKLFHRLLNNNGFFIFSFVKKEASYSPQKLGGQKFFSKKEMVKILAKNGFEVMKIWNYGYPLANILAPFFMFFLGLKNLSFLKSKKQLKTKETGYMHENIIMRIISLFINPITIYPFAKLQLLFKNTDLGNGYIMISKKR